jgi:hypothetical protein
MNDDSERIAEMFAFRCPKHLHAAMAAAAKAEFIPISGFVRQAIVKALSERGLTAKHNEHRAA